MFDCESPVGFCNSHMLEDPPAMRDVAPHTAGYPQELCDLVALLLKKEPDQRPTAQAAIYALRQVRIR